MTKKVDSRRLYALDTNVLLHDPTALFRFEEHDVFIPMTVLEELDEKKQGVSEVARNARQASRSALGQPIGSVSGCSRSMAAPSAAI